MAEIIDIINKSIENLNLLEGNISDKAYQPNLEIARQNNEINRLMDSAEIDFNKAKEEILKLAGMKYACCFYDEKILNTDKLREILSRQTKQTKFDIDLFKAVVSQIRAGYNYVISVEFINGKVIESHIKKEEK